MFSSFFHFGLYPTPLISYIAVPHFLFVIMPSRGWVAQTLTVMEEITAYSILKELGNDV